MQNKLEITSFDAHADEDLREYMMSEKDKDATDTMMSGTDIERQAEELKNKRRARGLY